MDTTIKNEAPKHWAASLKENDQVIATIRHETDGEKNLCDVLCKVMSNSVEREKVLVEYLRQYYTVRYSDLTDLAGLVSNEKIIEFLDSKIKYYQNIDCEKTFKGNFNSEMKTMSTLYAFQEVKNFILNQK